jgi:hypothetical protein
MSKDQDWRVCVRVQLAGPPWFDQPSKAVEWLIKAAIHKLPWIDPSAFVVMPDGQQQAGPHAGKQ